VGGILNIYYTFYIDIILHLNKKNLFMNIYVQSVRALLFEGTEDTYAGVPAYAASRLRRIHQYADTCGGFRVRREPLTPHIRGI
jgi:hypothetical protein